MGSNPISTPITHRLVRGAAEREATDRGMRVHRLPAWVRQQCPDPQLLSMEAQPSGVRVALRTSARALELVSHSTHLAYRGLHRPRGIVDVFVDGELASSEVLTGGDIVETDLATGERSTRTGPSHTTVLSPLPEGDKRIEFWLPHNESVELVELRSDAPVHEDDVVAPLWIQHGSSISQGSNTTHPSRTWPAIVARRSGVDLRNLGFGGSALLDPFMARMIRDAPADFISIKLGINLVNLDAMHVRPFVSAVHGFLDTIRDGHPTAPIIVLSPIFCAIHEDTPGPGAFDPDALASGEVRFIATGNPEDAKRGRLTLRTVREQLRSVVERRADDANLHFLDGLRLFGEADAQELPHTDALHPSPAAHERIGGRFFDLVFGEGGPFARSR